LGRFGGRCYRPLPGLSRASRETVRLRVTGMGRRNELRIAKPRGMAPGRETSVAVLSACSMPESSADAAARA
jgi:hypothetical protein